MIIFEASDYFWEVFSQNRLEASYNLKMVKKIVEVSGISIIIVETFSIIYKMILASDNFRKFLIGLIQL